ncbi:hypothetical protein ACE7GA_13695 [Roseomonas sp. CCTCC AB2023176]|uniref:hypothetical protein n=1 Tax=Roseomonas sp. CCTCC AB2023176 TaxID=3342640 RepID=UPI0035DFC7E2
MPQWFRRAFASVVVALACVSHLPARAAPVNPSYETYLDAGAWLSAVAGRQPAALVPLRTSGVTTSDGYGTYTDLDAPVRVTNSQGEEILFSRRQAYANGLAQELPRSVPVATAPGTLDLGFGCYAVYFPCLGLNAATVTFDQPILGFGGRLSTAFLNRGIVEEGGNLDDLLAAVAAQAGEGVAYRYDGFFGILFDRPVMAFDFVYSPSGGDAAAYLTFTNTFAVAAGVPEPSTLMLLAPFIGGLLIAQRARSRG